MIFRASPINIFTLFNCSLLNNSSKLATPLIYGSQPIIAISFLLSNCHFICSPEPKPISNQISLIFFGNNFDKFKEDSSLIFTVGKTVSNKKIFFYLMFSLFFYHAMFFAKLLTYSF